MRRKVDLGHLDAPVQIMNNLPGANKRLKIESGQYSVAFPEADAAAIATGALWHNWVPFSAPRFELTIQSPDPKIIRSRPSKVMVSIGEQNIECHLVHLLHSNNAESGTSLQIKLTPIESCDLGRGTGLSQINFGVVNFVNYDGSAIGIDDATGVQSWLGRLVLEAKGWRVTIDSRADLDNIEAELGAESGYAITHAGRLEKIDGQPFDAVDGSRILDVTMALLTFAKGRNVSFVLHDGRDGSGNQVWRRLSIGSVSSWTEPLTWFNKQRAQELNKIFCHMVDNWDDEAWRKSVQLAMYWYVLSLQNESKVDASIVLAFTALELVSWFWLAELDACISRSKFNDLDAASRVRHLLQKAGIDLAIPGELHGLSSHATGEAWGDGPAAIAAFRNAAVHPRRRDKIFDAPEQSRSDAATLAFYYLEKSLLCLFGYSGTYVNRVRRRVGFGVEQLASAPMQATLAEK